MSPSLQPDNETLNVSVSVTDDVRWMDRTTRRIGDTNVTLVLAGANFSEDSNNTWWTPMDHTVNPGTGNHSAREMTWSANPTSNASDSMTGLLFAALLLVMV